METYRSNQIRLKGHYSIPIEFIEFSEVERYAIGEKVYRDGIESISINFLQKDSNFSFFDLGLFKYFKNIKSITTYYNIYNYPDDIIVETKNIESIKLFKNTLEVVNISNVLKDLNYLKEFIKLKSISVNENSFAFIHDLPTLEELYLVQMNLVNLSINSPNKLLYLFCQQVKFLNNIINFNLDNLKGFNALMCRDFTDLSILSNCKKLEAIYLHYLPNVEVLPDFSKYLNLKNIWISTLSKLKDIKSISTAKNLETLLINNCKELVYKDFKFLAELPNLKYVVCDTKSRKEDKALKDLFGDKYNVEEVNKNFVLSP